MKESGFDAELVKAIKHIDTFYEKPPPGLIKDKKERPEDCIPDTPENQAAREFLAKAPNKGLWMPLGKEVKVMQCWRCKNYGHRTGDKECPMFLQGNPTSERFRYLHEDPMANYCEETRNKEKQERVNRLKALLDESDSSDTESTDSSSSSSSSSSSESSFSKSSTSSRSHCHGSKRKKREKHMKKDKVKKKVKKTKKKDKVKKSKHKRRKV